MSPLSRPFLPLSPHVCRPNLIAARGASPLAAPLSVIQHRYTVTSKSLTTNTYRTCSNFCDKEWNNVILTSWFMHRLLLCPFLVRGVRVLKSRDLTTRQKNARADKLQQQLLRGRQVAACCIVVVSISRARLLLGWVTVCWQVNHLGMYVRHPTLIHLITFSSSANLTGAVNNRYEFFKK